MKTSRIQRLRELIITQRLIDTSLKLVIFIISVVFTFGAIT